MAHKLAYRLLLRHLKYLHNCNFKNVHAYMNNIKIQMGKYQ